MTDNKTGDARTPDKRIGEAAYAEKKSEKSQKEGPAAYAPHFNDGVAEEGGASDPRSSKMEPEK
jgi:hypothetical protein